MNNASDSDAKNIPPIKKVLEARKNSNSGTGKQRQFHTPSLETAPAAIISNVWKSA